jgi:hypothetical protein
VTVKSKKGDVEVSVDEEYKGLKLEKVPTLKPVFKYPPYLPLPPPTAHFYVEKTAQ